MKKLLALLLLPCAMSFFVACGSNTNDRNPSESNDFESTSSESKPGQTVEVLDGFKKTASLSETVMVDEDGIKITATGLNYTYYSVELELTIENNSEVDLSFISGSVGYCCNSINGYMVNDGYLNCDVMSGKKVNDTISFDYDELLLYGINEIADIEIGFDISDDDYNHIYSGPRQVKTSAYNSHNYSKECYQETITSKAAMNTYEYEIEYFSKKSLYDVNGIKMRSSAVMTNSDGETALLLELENTTSNIIYISTTDVAINELLVSDSVCSYDAINPNKRCVVEIELSEMLDLDFWSVYGMEEMGSIKVAVNQRDFDGMYLADEREIEVIVSEKNIKYDKTGTELYNNNGVKLVFKDIVEDPSQYSSYTYVFLLAENKSGKTLDISVVYDSLSVNDFMTEYSFYGMELKDGESAVIEILLWKSSLEANGIDSASAITDIEFKLEIEEDYDIVDEATVNIVQN